MFAHWLEISPRVSHKYSTIWVYGIFIKYSQCTCVNKTDRMFVESCELSLGLFFPQPSVFSQSVTPLTPAGLLFHRVYFLFGVKKQKEIINVS